jgi:hypothetical protein
MLTYLRRLVDERTKLTGLATQIADAAAGEDRDMTNVEIESVRSYQKRCDELDKLIEEHNSQVKSQRAYASLISGIGDTDTDGSTGHTGPPATRNAAAPMSLGRAFVESDAFRGYRGRGRSESVELPVLTRAAADPIKLADLATIAPPYVFTRDSAEPASVLLTLVSTETVSGNAIQYMIWGPDTAMASVVPEGELKPPADLVMSSETTSLDTYAWWKALTRQALEDVPRIQSIIEQRLQAGITRALEKAVGDALTAATLATATAPAVPAGSPIPQLLANIRVGIGQVQALGYTPTVVALNPADFALVDLGLLQATTGGPTTTGPYWGVRPVAVPGIPAGTAYVGDFATGITLFQRANAEVFLTDSHADFFLRNQLVILAEQRAKVAVVEPPAIVEVPSTATPVTPLRKAS